jgi:hypothetical protein
MPKPDGPYRGHGQKSRGHELIEDAKSFSVWQSFYPKLFSENGDLVEQQRAYDEAVREEEWGLRYKLPLIPSGGSFNAEITYGV